MGTPPSPTGIVRRQPCQRSLMVFTIQTHQRRRQQQSRLAPQMMRSSRSRRPACGRACSVGRPCRLTVRTTPAARSRRAASVFAPRPKQSSGSRHVQCCRHCRPGSIDMSSLLPPQMRRAHVPVSSIQGYHALQVARSRVGCCYDVPMLLPWQVLIARRLWEEGTILVRMKVPYSPTLLLSTVPALRTMHFFCTCVHAGKLFSSRGQVGFIQLLVVPGPP